MQGFKEKDLARVLNMGLNIPEFQV